MTDGRIDVSQLPPDLEPVDRRERYARAISAWHRDPEQALYAQGADAVMAVADAEMVELRARVELAERRAAALEQAMKSTAADALAHGGCHRKLMAQCQRAEQSEAAVSRVLARLDAWEQRLPENVRKDTVLEVLRRDLGDVA